MIGQAVIMAGGLGSRLKNRTKSMPKAFIEIDGEALVERSVKKLFTAGIEEIIIGTGHGSEHFERLQEKYRGICLTKNERYAETGSMGTLACCLPLVQGDALVLESDLLYDDIGLWVLINDPRRSVILASGATQSGDEVYLEADDRGNLKRHSKNRAELGSIFGELVGITKLAKSVLDKMSAYCADEFSRQPKMEYETAMSHVSGEDHEKIAIRKIEHYAWCEIDDEAQLARAVSQVYPLIRDNESRRSTCRDL